MKNADRSGLAPSNRGVALAIALVTALLVSITAIVVINLAARRYHVAHLDLDHGTALSASEGGIRYAWTRLRMDSAFNTAVQNKAPLPYIVTSDKAIPGGYDEYVPALQMEGKNVTVKITFNRAALPNQYSIDAHSDYGG